MISSALDDRDAEPDVGRPVQVQQRAEHQRRGRLADVEARVDDAVDPAGRVRRRGALDDQVARRAGDARGDAHAARTAPAPPSAPAARSRSSARTPRRCRSRCRRSSRSAPDRRRGSRRAPCRRRSRPCRRSGTSPPRRRHLVQLARRLGRERLDAADDDRVEEEEAEADPDRGNRQEVEAAFARRRPAPRPPAGPALVISIVELRPVQPEHAQHDQRQHAGRRQGDAPARSQGDRAPSSPAPAPSRGCR